MDISFQDKKLEVLAKNYSKCRRKLGDKRAKLFITRLNALRAAVTLEDVRHVPGRFHELVGDRKGQWGCDLDHPYRLLFTAQQSPIPTNESGQYVWLEITAVEIIEIDDYH